MNDLAVLQTANLVKKFTEESQAKAYLNKEMTAEQIDEMLHTFFAPVFEALSGVLPLGHGGKYHWRLLVRHTVNGRKGRGLEEYKLEPTSITGNDLHDLKHDSKSRQNWSDTSIYFGETAQSTEAKFN